MSSINIYLSEKDKAEIKRISAVTGKSASDLVREMIKTLSTQYPEHQTHDIHLCWELRDVSYGKSKTEAWVSKDGKCIIIRSEYNMSINIPIPCDSDIVHTVNKPNQRTKIKSIGNIVYDRFVDTKHINVCDGGYELDGITWDKLPSTEYEFYIEGCDE